MGHKIFISYKYGGADFAYLQRGSDKTQEKINDAIPHT